MWGDALIDSRNDQHLSLVLILVLVEDVGGRNLTLFCICINRVLILVLVEDVGGRDLREISIVANEEGLNPCFGGRCGGTHCDTR